MHIALETLETTRVGIAVKKLTKNTKPNRRRFPDDIVLRAKDLVSKWRAHAKDAIERRRRRKKSGVDDIVVPRAKRASKCL